MQNDTIAPKQTAGMAGLNSRPLRALIFLILCWASAGERGTLSEGVHEGRMIGSNEDGIVETIHCTANVHHPENHGQSLSSRKGPLG
jgi:hypothetical protein